MKTVEQSYRKRLIELNKHPAVKMKPMKILWQFLNWFCVYPCSKSTPRWKNRVHIAFTFFIFVGNCCGVLVSTAFFFESISTNLENSLYAILQIASCAVGVYAVIFMLLSRQKITANLNDLARIYDECKHFQSFQYLFVYEMTVNVF